MLHLPLHSRLSSRLLLLLSLSNTFCGTDSIFAFSFIIPRLSASPSCLLFNLSIFLYSSLPLRLFSLSLRFWFTLSLHLSLFWSHPQLPPSLLPPLSPSLWGQGGDSSEVDKVLTSPHISSDRVTAKRTERRRRRGESGGEADETRSEKLTLSWSSLSLSLSFFHTYTNTLAKLCPHSLSAAVVDQKLLCLDFFSTKHKLSTSKMYVCVCVCVRRRVFLSMCVWFKRRSLLSNQVLRVFSWVVASNCTTTAWHVTWRESGTEMGIWRAHRLFYVVYLLCIKVDNKWRRIWDASWCPDRKTSVDKSSSL